MAKLILSYEGTAIAEFELEKEHMTIGRRPENDIRIDNLAVSGRHAKIITILNDSFLEDMSSTNGTYVNGMLIKKHALQDGDTITVGRHELKYARKSVQAEYETSTTQVIRTDAVREPPEKSVSQFSDADDRLNATHETETLARTGSSLPPASLRVLTGVSANTDILLTKPLTTLGKPGIQVAAIHKRPSGYFILHVDGGDVRSSPTVNGERISARAKPLHHQDVIEVAGVRMKFVLS